MSSKPTRNESTDAERSHADAAGLAAENPARDEQIRCRAYEIYLEYGQQAGRDLDNWLQAERELKTRFDARK